MLAKEQIETNKNTFLDLIDTIKREFNKERLKEWLLNSDFFTAPATTKYHNSYEGGLCEHSLNVYNTLVKLNEMYNLNIEEDSLKIVGLLHDISKANYFEKYIKNVKNENGEWTKVEEYRIKDNNTRFIFGSDEQVTDFMVATFLPLKLEEEVALLHKTGGKGSDSAQDNIPLIFNKYKLAVILHCADMLACYLEAN